MRDSKTIAQIYLIFYEISVICEENINVYNILQAINTRTRFEELKTGNQKSGYVTTESL